MAFIEVEKGNPKDIGKRIPLESDTTLIGRVAPGNEPDIILSDEYISRRHAEIVFDQSCYHLRDLNSTNGTSIDSKIIESGKSYLLQDGSLIGLGITPDGPRILLRFKGSPTVSTTRYEGDIPQGSSFVNWLTVDESKGEVWVDKKPLILPRKEYALLNFLYKKAGTLCSREELISAVWPEVVDTVGVTDAAIDQLVHRLRSKIEIDPSHPERLVNRKGFGFILVNG
jgi:DNA-binding winged helix-turn-helix (wHTH) protein